MVVNPEVTQKIQRLRLRSLKSTSIFAHLPVAEYGEFTERGPKLRAQRGFHRTLGLPSNALPPGAATNLDWSRNVG
jgi:hypothetical protein